MQGHNNLVGVSKLAKMKDNAMIFLAIRKLAYHVDENLDPDFQEFDAYAVFSKL